jgi:pyruvate/2-oxoglutarate dehydrogenase complex dihydrolipoamide dehydrogenase (E3) component
MGADRAGVVVISEAGEASFVDAHTILLADGRTFQAEKFILCAGGHSRRLDFPGAELALTHKELWELKQLPGSLAIALRGAEAGVAWLRVHDVDATVQALKVWAAIRA